MASMTCLSWLVQLIICALSLALFSAGNNIPARIAMITIRLNSFFWFYLLILSIFGKTSLCFSWRHLNNIKDTENIELPNNIGLHHGSQTVFLQESIRIPTQNWMNPSHINEGWLHDKLYPFFCSQAPFDMDLPDAYNILIMKLLYSRQEKQNGNTICHSYGCAMMHNTISTTGSGFDSLSRRNAVIFSFRHIFQNHFCTYTIPFHSLPEKWRRRFRLCFKGCSVNCKQPEPRFIRAPFIIVHQRPH